MCHGSTCPCFYSRMNLVDPSKSSGSMESRLTKYAFRGFRVAVPGYSPELASCPSFYKIAAYPAANGMLHSFLACVHRIVPPYSCRLTRRCSMPTPRTSVGWLGSWHATSSALITDMTEAFRMVRGRGGRM